MHTLTQKLLSRLTGGDHAKSGLMSFGIIMLGSLLQFIMFSLSARALGPVEFGLFAFVFNVTSFMSVAGVLGQEKLINRLWHEYSGDGSDDRAMSALSFTSVNVLFGSMAVALIVEFIGWLEGYPWWLLASAAALSGVQVILSFTSSAARPIAGLAIGAGLFEIVWRVLTIAGLALALLWPLAIDTAHLAWLMATSMAVAIAIQFYLMRDKLPSKSFVKAAVHDRAEWWQRSAKMWGSALVEAAAQFVDVIVIGLLFDFVAAGAYFAATRIAAALHRVSLGAATLAATQVSLLYFHRPREELRAFISSLSWQTTVLALAGFVGLVVLGKPLLALFGPAYVSEYWTLLLVASGALVTATFCIAPQLLLLTGHEGTYLRVISVALVVRLVLLTVLIQMYGTLGAALALVIVAIFTAVVLNIYCRRLVGVDASIFASIFPIGNMPMPTDIRRSSSHAPRIVLLQTQAEFGGAQEISRAIGKDLEARGYDVHHAFVYQKSSGYPASEKVYFASEKRPSVLGLPGALLRLRSHIAHLKPDAVMTFQHYGNIIGAPIAKLAGVKFVVANLNSAIAACPKWVPAADLTLGSLGAYSVVVSNSAKTSEEFSSLDRLMGDRMIRIDHGVEAKRSSLTKAQARDKLGLPKGVQLIGCGGRLHHQKNQQALIALLPLQPHVHLSLAGDGAERQNLVQQAETLGVAHRLHLLGELNPRDIPAFLAAIDAFVFPSLAESFGLAVAEAAIVGVPVICNDLPILREVLAVDGEPCALFVDANDPAKLSAAVGSILNNPERARELTSRSGRLEAHHSLHRMVDGYEAILKNAGVGVAAAPAAQLLTA